MHDDLLIFPIIGWKISTLPEEGIICVRFTFLTSESEKLSEAEPGKPHAMHAEQAREFRDALTGMIQRIEDYESEPRLWGNHINPPEKASPRRNADRRKCDRRRQFPR